MPSTPLVPLAPPWLDRAAYPFRSHRLALPGTGHELHFVDEGQGDPIVLVHGTPTWSFEWRHLVRALSSRHRCIAPDLLGFGLSDRPRDATYTPEAHAQRLAAFVDALGLERFTLVVHDFGGPIGLPLALAGRVDRLVVFNSWMWRFDDPVMVRRASMIRGWLGRWMYRRLNASLRLVMPSAYGDREKLTREIHAQYRAPFPDADSRERVLFALARALLDSGDHYADLWSRRDALADVPTLVVWGLADSAFPPPYLERWREALPHADVVALDGVGHWPHEEAPDAAIAALERFLAAHPVRTGRSAAGSDRIGS